AASRPPRAQVLASSRAQLPRRARRSRAGRRANRLVYRFRRALQSLEPDLRDPRSSLPERGTRPRESDERAALQMALAATEAGAAVARASHPLRNLRSALRVRRGRRVKALVCRCEDVTLHDLDEAIDKGHRDIESLKRYTGFGTGYCQGKWCLV